MPNQQVLMIMLLSMMKMITMMMMLNADDDDDDDADEGDHIYLVWMMVFQVDGFCEEPDVHCNYDYGHSLGRGAWRLQ